jgi:capsular polysaccharide biosynthesis protein
LDVFRYISYVRQRWRLVACTCLIAVALAGGVSAMLPRMYTATARILIEPPAQTDPRAVMAISAIYLESLKTYEDFATSDSLFQKAVERFQLRAAGSRSSFESLKKNVLKAAIVRNTRILEISTTLRDPEKAHALAQFLAEQTVATNRALIQQSEREAKEGQKLKLPDEERKTAQSDLAGLEALLLEERNGSGSHDERLTILDPGVVPERPSSPNVPANVIAALLLGLILPLVYLAMALGFQQYRAESRRGAIQSLGQSAR